MTVVAERELAAALRLARFRGNMNDEDFARLVKEVVRVFYKFYLGSFDHRTLPPYLPA